MKGGGLPQPELAAANLHDSLSLSLLRFLSLKGLYNVVFRIGFPQTSARLYNVFHKKESSSTSFSSKYDLTYTN